MGESLYREFFGGDSGRPAGTDEILRVTREQHSEAVFITFTGTSEASTVLEGRL